MNKLSIADAKSRVGIPALWRHFGYPGEPRTSCRCPWREDHKPSFSVTPDGMLWHDFATGEAGDAVDFFQRATGLSKASACRKLIELAGGNQTSPLRVLRPHPAPPEIKPKLNVADFKQGTRSEFEQLAQLRGIGREGLEWAGERGLLLFATLRSHLAWIVTDATRRNAQARRMDGKLWEHINAKAWTLPGSSAAWPIGITEAASFPAIALCEGGPDFLAAHYLALWEQASHYTKRDVRCAPVTMLGANLRIHPEALPLFVGKHVRIIGHDDKAGREAVKLWAQQLQAVGVGVDALDFTGLHQMNGTPVRDLNDSLSMDHRSLAELWRILP
jgi:hypothetical protein